MRVTDTTAVSTGLVERDTIVCNALTVCAATTTGSTLASGRALIGNFTPVARTGEFFGLWGLAARCAAIIGPATYGAISWLTGGDQRMAMLSTLGFFVAGLALLFTVDEDRGKRAAMQADSQ